MQQALQSPAPCLADTRPEWRGEGVRDGDLCGEDVGSARSAMLETHALRFADLP